MIKLNKTILIGVPDAGFAEGLSKNFEKSGLKILGVTVTLDHFLEHAYALKGNGEEPSAFLLSTSITKRGTEKRLEEFADIVINLREDFENSSFLIMSDEDTKHPLHAELISIGVFNIFERNELGKGPITISSLIGFIDNSRTLLELKDMRNYDRSIPWRNVVSPTSQIKISVERKANGNKTTDEIITTNSNQGSNEHNPKEKHKVREELAFPLEPSDTEEIHWSEEPKTKVVYRDRILGQSLISIASISKGLGSTHTSILAAAYLNSMGYKTEILECSATSNAFEQIENAYNGQKVNINNSKSFCIENVTYVKNISSDQVIENLEDYTHIILDLGQFTEIDTDFENEFLRSTVQILIAPGSLWKENEIQSFIKQNSFLDFSKIKFLIPFADRQQIDDLKNTFKDLNTEFYSVPLTTDPFYGTPQSDAIFEKIFNLPMNKRFKKYYKYVLIGIIVLLAILVLGFIIF